MKILFITQYFPPEVCAPANRTHDYCKKWASLGHKVTVITAVPNHPTGKIFPGYKNKIIQKETIDGIEVVRSWIFLAANKGVILRSLNYLSFLFSSIIASLYVKRPDIVIATSPQLLVGLSGFVISRLKRRPFIFEVRDLWPESIEALGTIKNRYIIRFLDRLALFLYRKADKIIITSTGFKNDITKKGISAEKIGFIPNGTEIQSFKPEDKHNEIRERYGLGGKFIVSYIGTMGLAHGLQIVLEAADKLKDDDNIVFLLIGEGAEREKLIQLKDNMRLKNVIFLNNQPHDTIHMFIAASDVLLVLLKKIDLFTKVTPSKIFEIMASARPIILGIEGEAKKIVQAAGSGMCIEPENSQMLKDSILTFYNNRDLLIKFGNNGREFILKNYDIDILSGKYLETIKTCSGE